MVFLYGCDGRLTAPFGEFRPGQVVNVVILCLTVTGTVTLAYTSHCSFPGDPNADFWTTARVVIILLWISPLWAWFARAIYGSVVRQVSSPGRRLSL